MAKEGLNLVAGTLVLSLILFFFSVLGHSSVLLFLGGAFLILSLFFVFFFRDPERKIPKGENLVLAPADGRIISLKNFSDDEFLKSSGTKVSIFLSVLDPHINRNPITGMIMNLKYNPGKFLPAFREKASLENEHTEVWLENNQVKLVMKQIAGVLARRIICRFEKGDKILGGERFGMIKFGSRVDLFLPENVRIEVELNEKVKAGETIIGRY
jgi:phosphatidylserine decarboxylase